MGSSRSAENALGTTERGHPVRLRAARGPSQPTLFLV
jgi:hypothetical protein